MKNKNSICAAVLFTLLCTAAFAQDLVTDFTTNDDSGLVRHGDFVIRNGVLESYTGTQTHVTIPANLGITEIRQGAFGSSLISVVIPQGVRTFSFFECYNLQSVTIPNSVTSIGDFAFHLTSLTSVTIPNSVTSIGVYAFNNTTSLTSITIPNSVTSIGYSAFRGCSGLTSISIGSGVTEIDSSHFLDCTGIQQITVDQNNTAYASADGVLFNKTRTELLLFPSGRTGSYIIPNSVTIIEALAFANSDLTSITIPAGVTDIRWGNFYNSENLQQVVVDQNNTAYASVDGVLFNKARTEILIFPPGKTGPYIIPNGITAIEWDTFANCSGLTSITIPASVTSIRNGAFSDCTSLRQITVDQNNTVYASADGVLFNKAQTVLQYFPSGRAGSYIIPNSVTSIGNSAFAGCTGLTSITIPNSVTGIGSSAFAGCTGLTLVTIPNSVTSIGGSAFVGCTSLTSVTISNSVTRLDQAVFSGCTSLTSVIIPAGVTRIQWAAFLNCTSLTSITIPANVTAIEGNAFIGTGLTSVTFDRRDTTIANSFPGDLRAKYTAANGGIGTYTRPAGGDVWTKR